MATELTKLACEPWPIAVALAAVAKARAAASEPASVTAVSAVLEFMEMSS